MTDQAKTDRRGEQHETELSIGRIRYRETGSGRPVVFVHGYLVDGELWRGVAPLLASQGFRCITPDLPLGAHELPIDSSKELSPRAVARTVRELIERLDLEDVVLVGNDSGGAICQMLVTESTERIGQLVLTPCDTFRKFPPFPYNFLKFADKLGPLAPLLYRASASKPGRWISFAPLLGSAYDDKLVRGWFEPGLRNPAIALDGFRFISSAKADDLDAASNAMAEIDLPTSFVWPRPTNFFKFKDGQRLAGIMRSAEMVPLETGQTFVPFEHPRPVAGAIAAAAA